MAIGKKMLQTYHFEHAKTIKKQNQQLNTIEYKQGLECSCGRHEQLSIEYYEALYNNKNNASNILEKGLLKIYNDDQNDTFYSSSKLFSDK